MGLWTLTNIVENNVSVPFGPNLAPGASVIYYIGDDIMDIVENVPDPSLLSGLTKEVLEELKIAQTVMTLVNEHYLGMAAYPPPGPMLKGKATGFPKAKE